MSQERHFSRRERREFARMFAFQEDREEGATMLDAWRARVRRSIEAGKQINRQYKNQVETDLRNAAVDKEAAVLESLTNSVGEEAAKRIVEGNRKNREARATRLAERRRKQASA